MRLRTLGVLAVLLGACSDGDADPKPDGGTQCENPHLDALHESEKAWKRLAAEGGDVYWYEHENCVWNAPEGQTFLVQVEGGKARTSSSQSIERDECQEMLNAYDPFPSSSFEKLYARCRELLERECDASFAADDRDVLRTCQWEAPEPECFDNCGEGVHIRRWDFGQAP